MIGLPEDDGWVEGEWRSGASRLHEERWSGDRPAGWLRALDASQPPETGGGGGRGGRGGRGARDAGDGREGTNEADSESSGSSGRPEDRPWTPIPRQAKSAERSLIPPQRRLKKTSRSA